MKIPESIKIGGTIYTVKQEDKPFISAGEIADASITYGDAEIRVWATREISQVMHDLLHEILHAINNDYRLHLGEDDVERLASGMFNVLVDNPDLFK
jgi:predicted Zn-dependent protease with MMP-like domain